MRPTKILISTALVIALLIPASAVDTVEYVEVEVKPVMFDEICEAVAAGTVEQLLYPSGLALPTKYLDLQTFRDGSVNAYSVPSYIANFLYTNWPTSGYSYTVAEVKAVIAFYSMYAIMTEGVREPTDEDLVALTKLDSETMFRTTGTQTNAYCVPTAELMKLLTTYQDILMIPPSHNKMAEELPEYITLMYPPGYDYPLSLDFEFSWLRYSHQYPGETERKEISNFLLTRQQFWDMVGVTLEAGTRQLMSAKDRLGYEGELIDISPVKGLITIDNPSDTAIAVNKSVKPKESVNPLNNYKLQFTGEGFGSNSIGVKDITMYVSIAIAAIAIAVFWIRSWIHKQSRLFDKWRKRW